MIEYIVEIKNGKADESLCRKAKGPLKWQPVAPESIAAVAILFLYCGQCMLYLLL